MKKEIYNYLNQYKTLYNNDLILNNKLNQNYNSIKKCIKCSLNNTKTNFIFGAGNPSSDIVFIGDILDESENLTKVSSDNRIGKLLEKILLAINLKRDDVYIINILKYKPAENANFIREEIAICDSCFKEKIKKINPKLIVALGKSSAMMFLHTKDSLINLRNKIHKYEGTDLLVTYHPKDLLNNPACKKPTWKDFKFIRDNYLNGTN